MIRIITITFITLLVAFFPVLAEDAIESEKKLLECNIPAEDIPETMVALPLLSYATELAEDTETYPLMDRMVYIGQDPCKPEVGDIIDNDTYPLDGYWRLLEAFPVLYESWDGSHFIGCYLRVDVSPLEEDESFPVDEEGVPTPVVDLDHHFKTFGEMLGKTEEVSPTINLETCLSVFEDPNVPLNERHLP